MIFTWSGGAGGISLGMLPASASVSNPGSTAVDINGNPGMISPAAATSTLISWADGRASHYVSSSPPALTRDAVLAFARSVR